MDERARAKWDVIVIGGALSGAATTCLLLRRNPKLRVLILERSEKFKRRVGESTVEISAFFLGRVLGLTEHLLQEHLVKQGLRFWFMNDQTRSLDQCSETGPGYNVRLPGYQVDRAVLDEHVLATAIREGATVLRGLRVRSVQLATGGLQTVEWDDADGVRQTTEARWVVDASGVAALLARQENWLQPNREHPTPTCWSRWSNVRSWDDRELAAKFPAWANRTRAVRSTATNHLVGLGWWAWWIPLKGGDVSIGVTYDQRLTELPEGPNLGARLRTMLLTHPAARELMAEARCREHDVHFRRHLPYYSTTFATDGAVLVGDAAGFIDPFYSPGMDWIAFTSSAAVTLIDDSFRGKPIEPRIVRHNQHFTISYDRWFRALYQNKYYYMGDQELMTLAFRLDLGLYYYGVVAFPFTHGARALEIPPFAHPSAKWPFRLIALYNRRFAAIARSRLARGTWGRRNAMRNVRFTSYEFDRRLPLRILAALGSWIGLELREGWRSWFAPSLAAPAAAAPTGMATGVARPPAAPHTQLT